MVLAVSLKKTLTIFNKENSLDSLHTVITFPKRNADRETDTHPDVVELFSLHIALLALIKTRAIKLDRYFLK